MNIALTPEEIEAIITSGSAPASNNYKTHFSRIRTHYPPRQTKHFKLTETLKPCASRGCTVPDNILIDGIHYCSFHAFHKLNEIIERLESGLYQNPPQEEE